MKKRLLLLILCPALTLGFPGKVWAQNEPAEKNGTVTIQYMDFDASGEGAKPIEGAMFSFYPIDGKRGKPHPKPYVTMKTDAEGVLTARLPEGEYKVCQEKNEVRYRTSDFRITIPMKNDQGVLTDEIEAVPKAEPVTESAAPQETPSRAENVTSAPAKQETPVPIHKSRTKIKTSPRPGLKGHAPSPKASTSKKKESSEPVKTGKVKTNDSGLYPAAAAVAASAAGLGTMMLIARKKQRKGDDKS